MAVAATTFGMLQSRIAARLIDPGSIAVSLANVQQAINDAVAYWKNTKFWFNQYTTNLILDIGDPYVLQYGNTQPAYPLAPVLPQNFLFEDEDNGFTIPYSNLTYNVTKVAPAILDDVSSNGYGIPFMYCFRNGNYEIYYLPQIAYTLKINYYADYQPMANVGDNNDFTNNADKLIEYDAIARLLSDLRMDDERASRFQARAQAELVNLKSRSRKQSASGRLLVNSILD